MENNDITYFGRTNFRGQEHVFGIKRDDRRRHMYVIGKTGMGKTTLLENMIIADIRAGNGLAIVDPHGDLAEEILNFIPSSRVNDVVYFNPSDIDYPIAFNVMEHVDPKYRHLVASGLIAVFKKIWADSWGPRLEYLLRNAILALLEYPDSTLLGVTRMLVDDDYRKKVVSKISDPVVKAFWTDEFTKYSKQFMVEAISPIQNKVGQFLSSALVRNIVSQPHSSINMRDIMDNRKIFIINLAKGRIGEDYSALLGAMLITKIQLAAMGRVDTPEPDRQDFYLYVDEFQNFATESFAGILSEARKYRLNLIVAHQYIGQLEETVRDAIFGNVGTIVSFRVGAADAEFLEKEFEPVFMMNDLVNLAKYDMYLKLMIDGVSGDAFSAASLPPIQVVEKSDPEKIIKVSRERYTKKREVVEDKVARWSGYVKDEESNELRKDVGAFSGEDRGGAAAVQEKKERTDDREMWDSVCAVCGTAIKVPFRPDPARQTYCKDCLLKVRKQMAEAVKTVPESAPTPAAADQMQRFAETPRIEKPAPAERAESTPAVQKNILQDIAPMQESAPEEIREVLRHPAAPESGIGADVARRETSPQPVRGTGGIGKPAYDQQKMIELMERKRRAAESREKESLPEKKVLPVQKTEAVFGRREIEAPSLSRKPEGGAAALAPASAPQRPEPAAVSNNKPKEKNRPQEIIPDVLAPDVSVKKAKEIKEGEIIKFD